MEADNILKNIKGVDNGYSVSLIVNTKGKGVPVYVLSYIATQIKESHKIFDIPVIFDLTGNLDGFISQYPTIKKTDTLIQVLCKINVEISEKDFSEYMERMVASNLTPFFLGCGFDVVSWYYQFNIPQDMTEVKYLEGQHSVVFKEKRITNAMKSIFSVMFEMNEYEIERVEGMFDMVGEFRVDNCLKEAQISNFEKFFNRLDINFEIE